MSWGEILVIARDALPAAWLPEEGAVPERWARIAVTLRAAGRGWLPRRRAERDPSWKQPIPYIVVRDGTGAVAVYRRRGREARLRGLWSLGIGGHVERIDAMREGVGPTVLAGARRELAEELPDCADVPLRFLGIVNEERTEVGAVHWGLVFEARAAGRPVGGRELGKLEWLAPAEAAKRRLELWSALALGLVTGRPHR